MKLVVRKLPRTLAGIGLASLLLCAGCEDDPRDTDYLKDSGAAPSDAAVDEDASADAATDGGQDAASEDAGEDDAG